MILRKFLLATALSAALLLPAVPAAAQATLAAGATVTDPDGGEVGTIASVDGDHVVLRTDRHEVRLPAASLAVTEDAILISLTREELNAQLDQMLAQAQQTIAVGTIVHDRDGVVVGPVEAVSEETVTVKLGEQPILFPRSAVQPGRAGLMVGASLAELQAQAAAAQPSETN